MIVALTIAQSAAAAVSVVFNYFSVMSSTADEMTLPLRIQTEAEKRDTEK